MGKGNPNAMMGMAELLRRLKAECPEGWTVAKAVGRWVWVEFDTRPAAEVRAALLELGFYWNRKRGVWQHCCGFYMARSPGDPRWKYGAVPVAAVEDETVAAGV